MDDWHDGMDWTNPPPRAEWRADGLHVTTGPETDYWRETFYGFVHDNGHFLHRAAPAEFCAEVVYAADYRALYDQAGLMLWAAPDLWIKAGIEYTDGTPHVSVVVTRGQSDWLQLPLPGLSGDFALRLARNGDGVRVQYLDADGRWQMVRLAYFPPGGDARVGPMCCSPTREGFEVTFRNFRLGGALSRELHA